VLTDFNFYQERSVGFGAHIMIVLCLIDYCVDNNIKCNIDIRNPGYSDIGENTWNIVFEQPFSNVNADRTITDQFSQIPNFVDKYWKLGYAFEERDNYKDKKFVNKYKKICKDYLIIKKEIRQASDNFLYEYKNKKILGIHRRGREHLTTGHGQGQEHLLNDNLLFDNIIDSQISKYDYLFLTSDETSIYNKFIERYENKLIIYDNKSAYMENKRDINYLSKSREESIESLKNLITEIIILSKCDKLLLMNSNVSHLALFLSDHNNYGFYDNHIKYYG